MNERRISETVILHTAIIACNEADSAEQKIAIAGFISDLGIMACDEFFMYANKYKNIIKRRNENAFSV